MGVHLLHRSLESMDLVRALAGGVFPGGRALVWGFAEAQWELGVQGPTPYKRYGCRLHIHSLMMMMIVTVLQPRLRPREA